MSRNWASFEDAPMLSRTQLTAHAQSEPRRRISAYASSSTNSRRGGFTSPRIFPSAHSTAIGDRRSDGSGGCSRRRSSSQETQQRSCAGQQSPAKLFDHAVRSEIVRRKKGCQVDTDEDRHAILESLTTLTRSAQGTSQAMSFTSDGQPKTAKAELSDAVDRLMRAEASVAFEGTVSAAQEAVLNAPRGLEEEAAAAGARGFGRTTKVTSMEEVRGLLSHGGKPIEVVGFVGITKPRSSC